MTDPLIDRVRRCLQELGVPPDLVERRAFALFEDAESLVVAEVGADGREHQLTPPAAAAWQRLQADARSQGVAIHLVSAFRSFARQREIIAGKLQGGQSPDAIFAVSAPPGCSEHHTGCAVDIGTPDAAPLEATFADSRAFAWLQKHAAGHGFTLSYPAHSPHGYQFEPWHWRFEPRPEFGG